jgi:hypothetical protein
MIYAVLLVVRRGPVRSIGFALGAILFAVFTISLFVTLHLHSPDPRNIVAIGATVDVVVFHVYSIRTAMALEPDHLEG